MAFLRYLRPQTRLDFFGLRHDERGAVLAGQHRRGGRIADDRLLCRVDRQHRPERQRRLVHVDVVGRQVLERPLERIADVLVGLPVGQRVLDLLDRGRLAEVIGDVGQVAVGAREVAFQDLGVQEFRVAGLDRIDEIAEVVAARR